MNVSGRITTAIVGAPVAGTEKGAARDALRTAIAFLSFDVHGVDPAIGGREALIAWLDHQCQSDEDWWVWLVVDARTRGLTLPLQANEASGEH